MRTMLLKAIGAAALPLLAAASGAATCDANSKNPLCLDSSGDDLYLVQKDMKHVNRRAQQEKGEERALQAEETELHKLEVGAGSVQPVMTDVKAAFEAMGKDGHLIKVDKGSAWPRDAYKNHFPPYSQHIEGLQRFRPTADGKNLFALSGTGTASDLFIAQMNDESGSGPMATKGVPKGAILKHIDINNEFKHAGGFQINGDLLAIGVEASCSTTERIMGQCKTESRVMFFDVSDPSNPKEYSTYIDRPGNTAGAVGIVKQQNGRWLCIVGNGDDADLDLYSQQEDGSWKKVGSWSHNELLKAAGVSGGWKSYQTHNLILQEDGTLFMVGTTRSPMMIGHDYFDLFIVQPSGGGRAKITMVASKAVTAHGSDFYAAAGIYVDSPTVLLGYASSWLPTTGTSNPPLQDGPTINLNEFR